MTERFHGFFVLTDTWCAVFHCIRLRDVWIAGGGKNVPVFIPCYLNPDASVFFSGNGLVAVAVDLQVTHVSLRACELMWTFTCRNARFLKALARWRPSSVIG